MTRQVGSRFHESAIPEIVGNAPGRAEESRGLGGAVKWEISCEGGVWWGTQTVSWGGDEADIGGGQCPEVEGRSRKGRMGKDGGRGRESSEGRAAFIPSTRDTAAQPGKTSYYYVRLEQDDGNLAWASPMWITYKP